MSACIMVYVYGKNKFIGQKIKLFAKGLSRCTIFYEQHVFKACFSYRVVLVVYCLKNCPFMYKYHILQCMINNAWY